MSGERVDAAAAAPDPLGMAAAAMASAIATGLALIAATVLGVRALRPAHGAAADLGAPFYVLLLGTLAGIILAGVVAWRLLSNLGSTYRRGALAVVSAFATVLFMLICMPVERSFGAPGLLGLVALSGIAAVVFARRARRVALDS